MVLVTCFLPLTNEHLLCPEPLVSQATHTIRSPEKLLTVFIMAPHSPVLGVISQSPIAELSLHKLNSGLELGGIALPPHYFNYPPSTSQGVETACLSAPSGSFHLWGIQSRHIRTNPEPQTNYAIHQLVLIRNQQDTLTKG